MLLPPRKVEVLKFCKICIWIYYYAFWITNLKHTYVKCLEKCCQWLIIRQMFIQEKTKLRFKARNSYYSVHTLLFSRFLSMNLKIKIYKTMILLVVLYGCETWSLILLDSLHYEKSSLTLVFISSFFGAMCTIFNAWRSGWNWNRQ